MSRKRHEPCVRCLGLTLPPGHRIEFHAHDWPQLIYAVRGVISVTTSAGAWVVPPMRALWVAGGVEHALHMQGRVEMQTLYFRPDFAPVMESECCVINIWPLLRELIVSIVAAGALSDTTPSDRARLRLLLDLLVVVPKRPLALPMPMDPRARRVAERVLDRVGAPGSLADLARTSGASARTIERAFLDQTGMTFGRWRQRARLLEAIRLLGEGTQVTAVAMSVGYRSPSAFVAAFKKCLGRTPAQYFRLEEASPVESVREPAETAGALSAPRRGRRSTLPGSVNRLVGDRG
ncbi:MAG: helix-turn-helix transcriptional regulator [Phycisphaeraceae bacterium]|nr:helix-turn-helix transcriptional regulator [Phycisphaerales bacterium]QOJ17851.1 MAG: helix-turn-helix transcriptional regulator [Phycisphaeraceae bacterium]